MVVPNGIGARAAMKLALEDAGLAPHEIDYINLHATSTPVGDVSEINAIREIFPKTPRFSSTKSMTGHTLGAAGVHEAIFCLLMMNANFIAPNINLEDPDPALADLPVVKNSTSAELRHVLSNSFGFGGTNCSLVFSRP